MLSAAMMPGGGQTPPHSHSLSGGSGPSTPTGNPLNPFAAINATQNGQQNQPAIASAFPNPPQQYIRYFTDEHVARGACLDPPRPVTDAPYMMFGTQMTCDDSIIRPLEAQGIKRLYPRDYDHKKELRKMNASILVNFLDLLDVLVKCPDTPKREEKCADIQNLFIQMHHLINELRPHQARETIRVTMQHQKKQRQDINTRLSKQIDKVHDSIAAYINALPDIHDTKSGLEDLVRLNELRNSDNSEDEEFGDDVQKMVELDSIMCNIVNECN